MSRQTYSRADRNRKRRGLFPRRKRRLVDFVTITITREKPGIALRDFKPLPFLSDGSVWT